MSEAPSPASRWRRLRLRIRFRWVLVALVSVLVVAYVAVEAIGREVIERVAEDQIRSSGVAGDVEVEVGRAWWTPSVTRLLFAGRLDEATVDLRSAQLYMVPVHRARYVLRDMKVSVSLRNRTMKVSSLGSGEVLIVIDPSSVSVFLGARVAARDGALYIGDSPEPVAIDVEGPELVINSPALEAVNGTSRASFPVVDSYLLPCEPTAAIRGGFIELRCTGSQLPGILGQTIGGGRAPANGGDPVGDPGEPPEIGPPQSTELDPSAPNPADPDPADPDSQTTVPGSQPTAPGPEATARGSQTTASDPSATSSAPATSGGG